MSRIKVALLFQDWTFNRISRRDGFWNPSVGDIINCKHNQPQTSIIITLINLKPFPLNRCMGATHEILETS